MTNSVEQRSHELLQRLSLRQTRADEQGQAPQRMSLGSLSPGGWVLLKLDFELTLKLIAKAGMVLGGTQ